MRRSINLKNRDKHTMGDIQASFFIMFVGFLFVAFSLGPPFMDLDSYDFNCTRSSGNKGICEFKESNWIDSDIKTFAVSELKEAIVYESCNKAKCYYSVRIGLKSNKYYWLSGTSLPYTPPDMKEYADKISSFINNTDQKEVKANYISEFKIDKFFVMFGIVGGITFIVGIFSFIASILHRIKHGSKNKSKKIEKKKSKKESNKGPIGIDNDNDDRNNDIFLSGK